ncbi:MAG: LPS export ABC transporter permease LptG [Alphaproteobacteria bacterium]|nr:LPS export ABC transporter permease LptG [Alphaproteobacteria bacterium]
MTYLFSTLNRYIIKQFFKWFGVCFLGIASIVLLFDMIELLRRMMGWPNVGLFIMVEILLLRLPGELQKMLPFIVLAGAMLTFSRMNQHSEMTATRAAGVSIGKILLGLMASVFVFGLINIAIIDPIRATLTERYYYIEEKIFGTKRNTVSINEAGLWLKEVIPSKDKDQYEERIFHALHMDLEKGYFKGISIYVFDSTGNFTRRINAEEGLLKNGQWLLTNAYTDRNPIKENKVLPTELTLQKIRDSNAMPETLSFWQIPGFIQILEKSGMSSLSYRMYYHKIIAQVGFMMIMVLLAAGFCLRPIRSSRTSFLISVCLLTGLLFHFTTDFVYALGLGGRLPPLLSSWLPSLMGLLLSSALLLHAEEG